MHFAERNEGDYRIYAGAVEKCGGFVAAVVVSRLRGVDKPPREAYRDLSIGGGHRWARPDEALLHAVDHARRVIRNEPAKLAC